MKEEIIKRAVDLWCKKLKAPTYDNGDKSLQGVLGQGLAAININHAMKGVDDLDAQIEKFRIALTESITNEASKDEYFYGELSVDYHPCRLLAEAGKIAGIPDRLFSIKSRAMIEDNYVSTSFGYGVANQNHYPLPDGRWLITTLKGSADDMSKILTHAMTGNKIEFFIDN